MADRWWSPSTPWVPAAVVLVTVPVALGSVLLLSQPDPPRTSSYFTTSPMATAAGLAAGLSLLLVGSVSAVADRRDPIGWLAVLAGAAWFAPLWAGWETWPPAVRSVAVLIDPVLVPVLVHLAAHSSRGRPVGVARRAVAATYVLVAGLVLVRALVDDPHRDRFCWLDCGRGANVLLVQAHTGLARGLGSTVLLLTLLAATAVVIATAVRLVPGTSGRPFVVAVAAPAALALVGEAGTALLLILQPASRLDSSFGDGLFFLQAFTLVTLAAGVAWTGGVRWTMRSRMAALVQELGVSPAPGRLQAHLARALRDDTLEVRYWSDCTATYVDASGRTPGGDVGRRAVARVVRGNEPVAVVLHHPSEGARRALEQELGSTARLVLDNERLRAERLTQAEELRMSRSRVAASADEHRRRLERDLHDGAQQRLIAATFELRMAQANMPADHDVRTVWLLDAAVEVAARALSDLRDFAHGVFPAVLDEAGLEEAVWSLVDTAPVAVEVECRLGGRRRGTAVERTAYLVVRAVLESPGEIGCDRTLRLAEEGQALVVEASGVGPVDGLHLGDRVGAVGGSLELGGGRLRAVLP